MSSFIRKSGANNTPETLVAVGGGGENSLVIRVSACL